MAVKSGAIPGPKPERLIANREIADEYGGPQHTWEHPHVPAKPPSSAHDFRHREHRQLEGWQKPK